MGVKVKLSNLVIDEQLQLRDGLNEDAVKRYIELFHAGKTKALLVQQGTRKLLDGRHRLEAARRAGLSDLWVEEKDVADKDLLAAAYHANKAHGVPLSTSERNRLITRLYLESGWTQAQIAELVGLTQQGVAYILAGAKVTGTGGLDEADKRRKLQDKDLPAIARLLLAGTSQEEVAPQFGVSRSSITMRWGEFRDRVKAAYEDGALKKDVASGVGLTGDEVDRILCEYEPEPLNFDPQRGSLWSGFQIDERFGQRHPGNVPAELVRNILHFYTRPGAAILDPFAGGGVVLDVAADMVGRKAYGYDLAPVRDDVNRWDILAGPPPVPEEPDLIFLDPPYGPMLEGKYFPHPSQLGDMGVDGFLAAMGKVFSYWDSGRLVLLMGCLRRDGGFVALPHECAKLMSENGWKIVDWLVNDVHRPGSENAVSVAQYRKLRLPMRTHIDIIVGQKT